MYAAEDKAKPIAIIVPAEPALKKLAAEHGIKGNGVEDLVRNEKLQGIVARELQDIGRKAGLAGIEIVEGVVMDDEEWTPQNVCPPPSPLLFPLSFYTSTPYHLVFVFAAFLVGPHAKRGK